MEDIKDAKGSAFDEVRKMLRGGLTSKLAKRFTPDSLKEEKKPVALEVSVTKAAPAKDDGKPEEESPEEDAGETPLEEKLEQEGDKPAEPDLKALIAEHVASILPKKRKA